MSNINDGDVIVQTLVDSALAEIREEKRVRKNIKVIDLLSEMLSTFEEKLGVKAEGNPGLNRKMGAEYFKRIDALEFAVKYDDGKDINGLKEADVVIFRCIENF